MEHPVYDMVVIGGGINGVGIARDAALRGMKVLLCEQHDLAQHTSSASTKLIHGGLRYLEYREFGLVRKALQERELLLNLAPHIMWPLRFVMPYDKSMRPKWMIRCGLFLYDHLARRKRLPASAAVDFRRHPAGSVLKAGYQHGFEYSDGWVQDARLVVLNAMDAAEHGATILTRTRCTGAERKHGQWCCQLQKEDGTVQQVAARALINAAGPWVDRFLRDQLGRPASQSIRLVKGSHIIVPSLFSHEYAYIFQNPDQRIIFAIPYEQDFTLIGTTDLEFHGDPAVVRIEQAEIDYLCQMSNRYFERQITPSEGLSTYSGVRPLLDDAADNAAGVTRDYSLALDDEGGVPLLSVFGGKITTYRKLAEQVVDSLAPKLGVGEACLTAVRTLPGGDFPDGDFASWRASLTQTWPWMPQALLDRYARAYGSRVHGLIGQADCLAALGHEIVPGLYEAEVRYLCDVEWARSAADILWRRGKLGLRLSVGAEAILDAWLRSVAGQAVRRQCP